MKSLELEKMKFTAAHWGTYQVIKVPGDVNVEAILENSQYTFPDRFTSDERRMPHYTSLHELLLHNITVVTPTFKSHRINIDEKGNLLLDTGGVMQRHNAGEVSLRPISDH